MWFQAMSASTNGCGQFCLLKLASYVAATWRAGVANLTVDPFSEPVQASEHCVRGSAETCSSS